MMSYKMFEQSMEIVEDTQKDKYLTFVLGNEVYGIEIKHVTEIISLQPITQIPEMPVYVKGIINLRGKIIPVMDVRLKFKKDYREYNDRTCVIVVDVRDLSIGLIVDCVSEVVSIPQQDIVSPPAVNTGFNNIYVKGIGKAENEVKILLDCERLLAGDVIEELESIKN